jgi:RHS repeat-associated protein
VTDSTGATATSTARSIRVNTLPSVSLTAPANGANFTAPANIAISATALDSDGTIQKVEFFEGGTNLIATLTAPPYSFTWTAVPQGTYSLTAVATDNLNGTRTSAPVSVTVDRAYALNFVHVDHLNAPRLVANAAGTTVWKWDQQEPFGDSVPDENPSGLGGFEFSMRSPGQYFDKETNLAYNMERDYDATIGRYAESDPIGVRAGVNTYLYVDANPISLIDPMGLQSTGRYERCVEEEKKYCWIMPAGVCTIMCFAAATRSALLAGVIAVGCPLTLNMVCMKDKEKYCARKYPSQ